MGNCPAAATATNLAAAGQLPTAVIADLPVGFGWMPFNRTEGCDDDRRDDEPARAAGEELGC